MMRDHSGLVLGFFCFVDLMFNGKIRISHCLLWTVPFLGRIEHPGFSREFHLTDDTEEPLFGLLVLFKGDMQVTKLKIFLIVFEEFRVEELDCLFFIESLDFGVAMMELNRDSLFFFKADIGCEELFVSDDAMEMVFFSDEDTRELKLMHLLMDVLNGGLW